MSGHKIIQGLKQAVEHAKVEPPMARSLWWDARGDVRVIAVVDSWVMARRPRCIPFVVHLNDWHSRYVPASLRSPGQGGE